MLRRMSSARYRFRKPAGCPAGVSFQVLDFEVHRQPGPLRVGVARFIIGHEVSVFRLHAPHLVDRPGGDQVEFLAESGVGVFGDSTTLVLHISKPVRDATYAAGSDLRSVSYFLAGSGGGALARRDRLRDAQDHCRIVAITVLRAK